MVKEISNKRLLRFSIVCFFTMVFIAVVFNVGIASASTSVHVDSENLFFYGIPATGGATTFNGTKFNFANTSFNYIQNMSVKCVGCTFGLEADATTFNCVSGGTCSGYAYYRKGDKTLFWIFSQDTIITDKYFVIEYATPSYFANISATWQRSTNNADATRPLFFCRDDSSNCSGADSALAPSLDALEMYVTAGVSTNNYYTISYIPGGLFQLQIIKENINTKVFINSSTLNYYTEPSFNTNPFIWAGEYRDGVFLNITTSDGGYTYTTVNISGSGLPEPTPTPDIIPDNREASIRYNKNEFSINEQGIIIWNLSYNTWTDIFTTKHIVISYINPDSEEIVQTLVNNPGQTGTYNYQFAYQGNYNVRFQKKYLYGVLGTKTLANAWATVLPDNPSYLTVNSSYPINRLITFSYYLGYTPYNPDDILIVIQKYNSNSNTYDYVKTIRSSSNLSNPYFTASGFGTIWTTLDKREGTYNFVLKDVYRGNILDTKVTEGIYVSNIPIYTINTTILRLDNTNYFWGDTIYMNYIVDDANYSNYSIYFDVISNVENIVTYSDDLGIQKDDIPIRIQTYASSDNTAGKTFYAGSNTIRLNGINPSGNIVILNQTNFNISLLTSKGYSVIPATNEICNNEVLSVKVITPTPAYFNISLNGVKKYSKYINGTVNLPVNFINSGLYILGLYSTGGELETQTTVNIKSCDKEVAPTSMDERTKRMMDNDLMYGILIIIGCFVLGSQYYALYGGISGLGIGVIVSYSWGFIGIDILALIVLIIILLIVYMLLGNRSNN